VFDNIRIAAEREATLINVPKMVQERTDAINNANDFEELEKATLKAFDSIQIEVAMEHALASSEIPEEQKT
jgi:hypothetical protein